MSVCLQATGCLFNHIRWGDAFLVVYSVCERSSFQAARGFLETLSQEKLPGYFTTVLLGNKRDIEHARWVQPASHHAGIENCRVAMCAVGGDAYWAYNARTLR